MSVARIAHRYAKSLIELSIEENALNEVYTDIESFLKASDNKDLEMMLKSPIIKSDTKQAVLDKIFGDSFHKITKGFITIVVNKGREKYLREVAEEFKAQYKRHRKISSVILTTAAPLGGSTVDQITEMLRQSPQTDDNIEMETKVDESLLGGFVLEFDGKLYDSSLSRKLDQLRKEFSINEYIKNM
ncbi:MAG: ATP synthase F1 subunit delta [Bacteroidota bacterium]